MFKTNQQRKETMQKKHYIKLAELLTKHKTMANLRHGVTHVIKKGEFMIDLCEYLKQDNSNFDEIKFREATGEILGK